MTDTTIAPDATLDALLAALVLAPRDADLCAVIADCLEETGYPAAAWWRGKVAGVTYTTPGRTSDRRFRRRWYPLLRWNYSPIPPEAESHYPGITDLCRRLDRAAQSQVDEVAS